MAYEDVHEQLVMLADHVRCAAFADAIAAGVEPGDRVLDFGCGTGILSILAERAGAARVDAVEQSPIIAAARRIAQDNGCSAIHFHACDARELVLAEPVDVIVSECMGHFAIYESMLNLLPTLRERWLRPGGRVIPRALRLMLAPVLSSAEDARRRALWNHPSGIDFGLIAEWPLHRTSLVQLGPTDVSADALELARLDLQTLETVPQRFTGEVVLSSDAPIFGLAGYFDAELCPGVHLATGPRDPATHWKQLYIPFVEPLSARAGESLRVELQTMQPDRGGPPSFAWTARLRSDVRRGDELTHRLWLRATASATAAK